MTVFVDVMNLAFRSYYAFSGLTHEGQPTGLYYGFIRAVRKLQKLYPQANMAFCWDHGMPNGPRVPNWRRAIFPTYKAGRDPSESVVMVHQMLPALKGVLDLLGYCSVSVPGLEADDVIGILTASGSYAQSVIYSTDKDLYQLIDESTIVLRPGTGPGGKERVVKGADVLHEYGISVRHWPYFLALGGDSSDGYHVIPGIGPKRALDMLALGARPDIPWEKNPESFTSSKYAKHSAYWPTIQSAYQVAHIPRSVGDPRLRALKLKTLDTRCREIPNNALGKFTSWCSDNGMLDFLDERREFFK